MLPPRPVLLLVALLPAVALAQAEPAPPPPAEERGAPKKLEKIEVEAPDGTAERRESTAAKIVVNRDEIERYGDTTIADVMKRLPGVTVRGNAIMMRGLGAGYTQILVDGQPAPPGFSIEQLSPDLIERIEIYRSATAEFSTQAIAGTINIVMRKAVSHAQRQVKLGANVANGEPGYSVSAQVSDRAGSVAYTLPLSINGFRFHGVSSQEQRAADAGGMPTQHYLTARDSRGEGVNAGFSPRASWTFAKDHSLNVDAFVNAGRFTGLFTERSTTFLGAPPLYASNEIDMHNRYQSSHANATWIRRFADASRIEAKLGVSYNTRDSHVIFDARDAADVFILHRTVDSDAQDSGITSTGKYVFPLMASHALVAGWDGAGSRRSEDRLQVDVSPVGLPLFNIDESYDARVLRIAGFAQDEWEVAPRLSVYLGLRWEGIDTSSTGNVVSDVSHRSGVWSPIVQALWKLPGTEKDQLRAGLARTYRAPSTSQIIPRRYIANNNTPTTPDYQGNPDLRPELAWGLDGAYEHYFTGGGVFSVSAFVRRIEDVILSELIDVNGTFIRRPANAGTAVTRGIELDTKVSLRTFAPSAPAIDLRANAARHWSRVDALPGPDNRLASQVPWSANLGFDWKLASVPLTVGGNYNVTAGGTVRASQTQVTYNSVSRNLEAYGLWKFNPATQLRVTLSNILAQEDLSVSTYFDANGSVELTSLSPAYRRLSVLLEMKL